MKSKLFIISLFLSVFLYSSEYICDLSDLPYNHVIVSVHFSTSCPTKQAYRIKKPSFREEVCSLSYIPKGYIVSEVKNSVMCPGKGLNQYTIQVPTDNNLVCSISQVPNGYYILKSKKTSSCPNYERQVSNAFIIKKK